MTDKYIIRAEKKEDYKEKFIQPDTRAIDDDEIIKNFFKGDSDSEIEGNIPKPPPPPPRPPDIPTINPSGSNN